MCVCVCVCVCVFPECCFRLSNYVLYICMLLSSEHI